MTEPLRDDLIARTRQRAGDPETRTDAPPTARGRTVSVGNLSVVGLDLGALLRGANPTPETVAEALASPLNDGLIAELESKLGFAVPQPLRQLYGKIADGGFGPGNGLMRLDDVVRTYLELLATPPGPRGQKWPVRLLPITRNEPGHYCIEVDSGKVVFWDEEVLADGVSDKVWKRSFKSDAPDLGAWFERWLGTISPEQRMKAMMQKARLDSLRRSLAHWRAMTPQERAAFGLPETGWEQALFGHLGIDLSEL
jgi:hypothetical protein